MTMRSGVFVLVAALMAGCATKPDPINRCVAQLSGGIFLNGFPSGVAVPPTASMHEIISRIFQARYPGQVTKFKILEVRQVHIGDAPLPENDSASQKMDGPNEYTAVLADTNIGQKIIIMRYVNKQVMFQRVFDSNSST
jgi:hypothetical protein